jgi:hypothetical protein
MYSYIKAIALGDTEAEIEASQRLTSIPLNMVSSLTSLSTFLYQIGTYIKGTKLALAKFYNPMQLLTRWNIFGFALSLIESIIEITTIKRLKKQIDQFHLSSEAKITAYLNESDPYLKKTMLLKTLDDLIKMPALPLSTSLQKKFIEMRSDVEKCYEPSDELIKLAEMALRQACDELVLYDAKQIQNKHFTIAPELQEKIEKLVTKRFEKEGKEKIDEEILKYQSDILKVKINKLARRVSPWFANELKDQLPALLEKVSGKDSLEKTAALKQIKQLLNTAKIQTKKYLITHIIALVTFSISAVVSTAIMVGCPPTIPGVIMLNLGLASLFNYIGYKGTIKQKGWKFSLYDALPSPIQWLCDKTKKAFQLSNAQKAT